MAKKHYLSATFADGYVKTIGPVATAFTHCWRIVALLENGKTEVFWGHTKSLAEAKKKRAPAVDAAKTRGWQRSEFESAEAVEVDRQGLTSGSNPAMRVSPEGWAAAGAQAREESPGSTEIRCRVTPGGGDPRESATESRPPTGRKTKGKGERVRQERTADLATGTAWQTPPGARPNRDGT